MNQITEPIAFGPQLYGCELYINSELGYYRHGDTLICDVETDEGIGFVGLGITRDGKRIDYITDISDPVVQGLLESANLIGHNVKFDLKQLIGWGFDIKPKQLFYDTCLASYVQNTTKESHGLKELAKEYLGMEWPSYKDMVGSGRKKITLDKQEPGRVAAYCGMDCLATFKLYEHFQKALNPQQKRYLETIELPTARALLQMELNGVQIDVDYLKKLDAEFDYKLSQLAYDIHVYWTLMSPIGSPFNVNSNKQVAELLQAQGAILPKTQKGNLKVDKQTLEQWKHLPVVPLLLEYSKIEKLKSTYTQALLEKQQKGRIYCSFNQISKGTKGETFGISTGRLSSSGPNLQNIPTRTEEGKFIRKAFIAGDGNIFIDADFSQIEPRLVAHFTKDKTFLDAYRNDRDIYQELVEGTGRDRQDGKTFMLALLYGAQPKKLASVFKCSEQEAEAIVNKIMRKLPGVTAWINRTKYEAKQKGGVWTLYKRWVPLPKINSLNRYERMHWERVAVNTIIQGSAAEIMKLALIKLNEVFKINLTVHDEYLIEDSSYGVSSNYHEINSHLIKTIMEEIVPLEVPLKASIGVGKSWAEAKI